MENGYTRIANAILEHIVRLPLNGTQFRILMVLWRETYGFNRKECALSETLVAAKTEIFQRQVRRETKTLISMDILSVVQEATFTTPRVISFNKDFDRWSIKPQGPNVAPPVGLDHSPPVGLDPHIKKPIKKPFKETCMPPLFDTFWTAYPKKKAKADAAKAFGKIKNLDAALFEKIMAALAIQEQSPNWQKENGQFVPYPAT